MEDGGNLRFLSNGAQALSTSYRHFVSKAKSWTVRAGSPVGGEQLSTAGTSEQSEHALRELARRGHHSAVSWSGGRGFRGSQGPGAGGELGVWHCDADCRVGPWPMRLCDAPRCVKALLGPPSPFHLQPPAAQGPSFPGAQSATGGTWGEGC